jgi:hypothetical protein
MLEKRPSTAVREILRMLAIGSIAGNELAMVFLRREE